MFANINLENNLLPSFTVITRPRYSGDDERYFSVRNDDTESLDDSSPSSTFILVKSRIFSFLFSSSLSPLVWTIGVLEDLRSAPDLLDKNTESPAVCCWIYQGGREVGRCQISVA